MNIGEGFFKVFFLLEIKKTPLPLTITTKDKIYGILAVISQTNTFLMTSQAHMLQTKDILK